MVITEGMPLNQAANFAITETSGLLMWTKEILCCLKYPISSNRARESQIFLGRHNTKRTPDALVDAANLAETEARTNHSISEFPRRNRAFNDSSTPPTSSSGAQR